MNIGVWGGRGSFTEEAALEYGLKKGINPIRIKHFGSIDELLTALGQDQIERAVFPVSNSIGGPVQEAVQASGDTHSLENQYQMDIHQCLLVFPGTRPSDIKEILSHPQPLRQCEKYLKRNFPNVGLKDVNDMSVVAADISASVLPPTSAVIASKRTAKIYNLQILAEDIQDFSPNVTTFSIVSK